MTVVVKFIPKYVRQIVAEEKTMTVRYGWDDDELPEPHEELKFQNSQTGNIFASAETEGIEKTTIEQFSGQSWEGHVSYKSVEGMCWSLSHFYDDEMDGKTEIHVISWTNLTPKNLCTFR